MEELVLSDRRSPDTDKDSSKETRIIMGMPITVKIAQAQTTPEIFDRIFSYFDRVDQIFSPYKPRSELSKINSGALKENDWSGDVKEIFSLARETKEKTGGYFDIRRPDGQLDPSGIVKGWAIRNAAEILKKSGFRNFYVDAGGDIEFSGRNDREEKWSIGVKNPWNGKEIIKTIHLENGGVATSGTYIRGQHIWNPKKPIEPITEIVSLTVIGPDVYEADRFATAAFAMGQRGIAFIESLDGLEGYSVDRFGLATMTTGFEKYTHA